MGFFSHPCGIILTTAHIIQCISSLVVLGVTAWAARETKTLTVIFSLVVVYLSPISSQYDRNSKYLQAVLTPIVYGITLTTSCITKRYRWHVLPLLLTDAVLSYLYDNMKHPFYSQC
jgi:hypothetical protein